MKIRIKRLHPEAKIPEKSHSGDAGMDLVAIDSGILIEKDGVTSLKYRTGISMEIPKGYVGLIFPRSSIYKTDLSLCNSVGVIDSGYRGEIGFFFNQNNDCDKILYKTYDKGDRIGQIMIIPYPQVEFEEVEELSDTERGSGGFGSSGK